MSIKLCGVVHLYPCNKLGRCGAEIYLHRTFLMLQSTGKFEIEVNIVRTESTLNFPNEWEIEGIKCKMIDKIRDVSKSDIYITQLVFADMFCVYALKNRLKCIIIAHSGQYSNIVNYSGFPVIYNANNTKDLLGYACPSIVWRAPIDTDYFQLEHVIDNQYITLINPIVEKGVEIFKRLAELMPHRKFLCVKGGYGQQVLNMPSNVLVVNPESDMLKIYRQTRLLLYPSYHESYGMSASEAQSCGIPVIAYDCPDNAGLVSNLGGYGVLIDKITDYPQWIDAINMLDDRQTYIHFSNMGRFNQVRKDNKIYFIQLINFLTDYIDDNDNS